MRLQRLFSDSQDICGAADPDVKRPEFLSYLFFVGLIATTFLV